VKERATDRPIGWFHALVSSRASENRDVFFVREIQCNNFRDHRNAAFRVPFLSANFLPILSFFTCGNTYGVAQSQGHGTGSGSDEAFTANFFQLNESTFSIISIAFISIVCSTRRVVRWTSIPANISKFCANVCLQ